MQRLKKFIIITFIFVISIPILSACAFFTGPGGGNPPPLAPPGDPEDVYVHPWTEFIEGVKGGEFTLTLADGTVITTRDYYASDILDPNDYLYWLWPYGEWFPTRNADDALTFLFFDYEADEDCDDCFYADEPVSYWTYGNYESIWGMGHVEAVGPDWYHIVTNDRTYACTLTADGAIYSTWSGYNRGYDYYIYTLSSDGLSCEIYYYYVPLFGVQPGEMTSSGSGPGTIDYETHFVGTLAIL